MKTATCDGQKQDEVDEADDDEEEYELEVGRGTVSDKIPAVHA